MHKDANLILYFSASVIYPEPRLFWANIIMVTASLFIVLPSHIYDSLRNESTISNTIIHFLVSLISRDPAV